MKNKIINITLGILIVASVGVNIYQYNQNNSMRLEADSIQTEIDNANTNYISLSESISAKGEEITTLGNKIADLEDNLSNLQSTNSSLSTQIADLETQLPQYSPYAGKTSKHGWVYPDDYVEYGPRYVDARSDAEMLFDEGAIDEAGYKEWVEAAEILKDFETSDTSSSQGTLEDLAREIATSNPPSGGNDGGSSTPATGGAPIEVPPAKEYEKTGRLCY